VVEADFEPGRDVPPEWLEKAGELLDLGAADLELPPMSIRLLVPSSQEALVPRMVRAARLSIAWFGLHYGPYPYPRLTVVSPPPGAGEAGGMEYPTLITTGASRLAAHPPFKWRRGIESVTVHEFGHQYFHSLVATNEFEQAWLDEGLTTWAQNKCLADIISSRLVPEMRFAGLWDRDRNALALMGTPVVIDRLTWEYRGVMDYFMASYYKTSVALRTLEGLVGEERMARAMRAYFQAHRYRHPTGDDLRSSLEEVLGEDLGWFFDAVIEGSAEPDWAVLRVRHRRVGPAEGMAWRDGDWHEIEAVTDDGDAIASEDGRWRIEIEIGRLGDLVGPVEVELRWGDGRSERRRWDGRDRWVRWSEESGSRLDQVVVDPDVVWALETRRTNNYWRDRPSVYGPLWWLDDAVRLIGLLTLPWA
jgi:aminopeptidase N